NLAAVQPRSRGFLDATARSFTAWEKAAMPREFKMRRPCCVSQRIKQRAEEAAALLFEALLDNPNPLFLTVSTIRQLGLSDTSV
ncbi:MAG TPA: hypothetical protein VKU00_12460, partial [Chthonomonadaceae bacterium]|nr:hypothetical protein [Chthonomonadaceae bacterium]